VHVALLAHEAWFTSDRPPYDWAFAAGVPSLLVILGALGVTGVWRAVARRAPRPELGVLEPLSRIAPWIPRLLAIHAGVSLLAQAARGTFLAPSLDLPADALGAAVGIAEGVLGVWLVGGSLVVLAFSEKLARPELALAFLDRFPAFNLLRTLGIPVSDLGFVRLAGAVELLFGLLLISGAMPQLVVLLAGVPFNATLFFLGTDELIGHLPIYGAMLAVLVYGSSGHLASVTDRFRGPWERSGVVRHAEPPVPQRREAVT
jgi:hypothetical protein